MKIVIAPDSFKESLSAEKCCQAIKAGFSTLFPDANYICLPIADGGEGTVDAMVAATGGNIVTLEVCGPMGEKVNAFYGLTGDGKTAVIEMAAASGLMLVAPEKRNPLLASSFGTGELIRHALDNGIRHIILGIGGSATVDGGMGMAQALGVRFLDADGQVLVANGGNLARVASIEMDECDPRLANCHIEVACDVDNPLVGARGAAAVILPNDIIIKGINDSKKLSEKKREELFEEITEKAIAYNIFSVDEKRIDEINILNATYEAMNGAVNGLSTAPDFVLIDGNRISGMEIPHETVVKGDSKSISIAAASILAKVSRDRFICQMAEKYPEYGFEKHKGYGTKAHNEAILKYGPCPIHRRTFLRKLLGE